MLAELGLLPVGRRNRSTVPVREESGRQKAACEGMRDCMDRRHPPHPLSPSPKRNFNL